jgi:phage terminase large subunit-like protein
MTGLVVPPFEDGEAQLWPSLGPQVCDLLEERAVYGPGDLRGQDYVVDPEVRAVINRAYQVFPQGHPQAGRRRFKRVVLSMRKGSRKTEIGAALAFVELHPEGPVRCDGFDSAGWPVGRPVRDPYIAMVAYTEEQTEELAYAALLVMVSEGPDADLFDPGLERITRAGGEGRAVALASSPDSRDGARTTFEHFDETHRFVLPRLVEAHSVMVENLTKRPLADPWACSTTTAYQPGEGSVAEAEHEYAKLIAEGRAANSRLFFLHREASPQHDIANPDQRRAAVIEASGPVVAAWSDINGICARYDEPDVDRSYWERVWCNRIVAQNRQAFDPARWAQLANPGFAPARRDQVTLGLDGSRYRDSTALIATHAEAGWQWPIGIWERPADDGEWEVPADEVDDAVDQAFAWYTVLRFYGDPAQGWDAALARWAGKHGPRRVTAWYTDSRNLRKTATMLRAYRSAMTAGELTHSGDERYARHVANARRRDLQLVDEDGQPLWTVSKERRDSPFKIDCAMAGGLSWQARLDALAAGELRRRRGLVAMTR